MGMVFDTKKSTKWGFAFFNFYINLGKLIYTRPCPSLICILKRIYLFYGISLMVNVICVIIFGFQKDFPIVLQKIKHNRNSSRVLINNRFETDFFFSRVETCQIWS